MSSVPLIPWLTLTMLVLGLSESVLHAKRLSKIPIRILVNGTRGKSTVTRLIAAALRGSTPPNQTEDQSRKFRTLAKTTGTEARRIYPDGTEECLKRKGPARISEQIAFIKQAEHIKADAVVVECMAVTPENQTVFERQLNHSTIGVLTNIRLDHTDVMGQDEFEIAQTLARSIPERAVYIAQAGEFEDFFRAECRKRGTHFIPVHPETIPDSYVEQFPYPVFKENLAVALAAAEVCGINERTAIARMTQARQDPGVVPVQTIMLDNRTIVAVNAFAANDAESTSAFWHKFGTPLLKTTHDSAHEVQKSGDARQADSAVVILNHRKDRSFRIQELWAVVRTFPVHKVLFCGDLQAEAHRYAKRHPGISDLGSGLHSIEGQNQQIQVMPELVCCGNALPEEILTLAVEDRLPGSITLVFLAGNMKGKGMELTRFIHTATRDEHPAHQEHLYHDT